MNELLTKLYRASKPKEALASQDEFKSANVLLGSDVEKFAELIIQECMNSVADCTIENCTRSQIVDELKEHFGVK
jgi:hypothetical protein